MASEDRKRVKILEENNTYHIMERQNDEIHHILSEVETMLRKEEFNEQVITTFLSDLSRVDKINKEAELDNNKLMRKNESISKSLELANMYSNELILMVSKLHKVIVKISVALQKYTPQIILRGIDRNLPGQCEIFRSLLDSLSKRYDSGLATEAANKQELDKLVEAIATNAKEIEELEQTCNSDTDKDELLNKIETKNNIIEAEKGEITKLNTQLQVLKEKEGELSLDIEDLQLNKTMIMDAGVDYDNTMKQQNEALITMGDNLQKSIQQETDIAQELEQSEKNLILEISVLSARKQQSLDENKQLKQKTTEQENLLTNCENRKSRLSEQMDEKLSIVAKSLKENKENLHNDEIIAGNQEQVLNKLREEINNLKIHIDAIDNITILENEKAALENSLSNINTQNSILEQDIVDHKEKLKNNESDIKNNNEKINEELKTLQNEENNLIQLIKDLKVKDEERLLSSQENFASMQEDFKTKYEESVQRHSLKEETLKTILIDFEQQSEMINNDIKSIESELNSINVECEAILHKKQKMANKANLLVAPQNKREQAKRVQPQWSWANRKRHLNEDSDSSSEHTHLIDFLKRARKTNLQ